uniref:Ankyrin repeat protein n=1 Tax=Rhabditophanes sp. KR3021 TaxID=114890 RepID=A0AC35UA61_9BILA
MSPESLQTCAKICVLKIMYAPNVAYYLPQHLEHELNQLKTDVDIFIRNHESLLFRTFILQNVKLNSVTGKFDYIKTIKSFRYRIAPEIYFQLCAINNVDDDALEVWHFILTDLQKHEFLISENEIISAKALELVGRGSIINYEHCAMTACIHGWLPAVHRSLLRLGDSSNLISSRCILMAIQKRHYHIANSLLWDNFKDSLRLLFPSFVIPLSFLKNLCNNLLNMYLARSIIKEIVEYLPRMEVHKIITDLRASEADPLLMKEIDEMCDKRTIDVDDEIEIEIEINDIVSRHI